MTIGTVFLILALVIFALLGMGAAVLPRAEAWGLFCLTLGVLLHPLPWPWPPR